jgi:hypothetical protein
MAMPEDEQPDDRLDGFWPRKVLRQMDEQFCKAVMVTLASEQAKPATQAPDRANDLGN